MTHRLIPLVLAASLGVASLSASAALAAPPAGDKKEAGPDPRAVRITGAKTYLPTFGLRASITRDFSVHGVLAVDAGLDIPSDKARKKAEAVMPRITSAMRDAVLSYASLSYVVGARPDTDMLHARMQKAVDGILGPDQAKVAIASVIVFPS
jgi:hypothetical protein